MRLTFDFVPREFAAFERRGGRRIGNAVALRGIGEGRERAELATASFGYRFRELRFEIAEELKRRARGPLFTHEEQRW